jgi:predicted secreted hydrolase
MNTRFAASFVVLGLRLGVFLGTLFSFTFLLGTTQWLLADAPPKPPPLAKRTADGFQVPQPAHRFEFPKDHGSHPGFKVEWWYVTGHLFEADTQERFGFQVTFFRRASAPQDSQPKSSGAFRSDQLYLFHAALLDVRSGKFLHTERLSRAGWEASSAEDTLDVQLNGNRLFLDPTNADTIHLDSRIRAEARLELTLRPEKPLVVFGEDGVSRKGDSPEAASWYLTFPRLAAQGRLQLHGKTFKVGGEAWMDHEISSSQLTQEQSGWDWAGIQFEDGREIMVYRLRRKDGSSDPASALFWVDASGKTVRYGPETFRWEGAGQWRSPRSDANYPLPVRLSVPDPETGRPAEFLLEPLAADQELGDGSSGIPYWEGACRVKCEGRVVGSAYVELTGYAGSLNRALK